MTFVILTQNQSTEHPPLPPPAGGTARRAAGEASDTSDSAGAAFGSSAASDTSSEGGDLGEPPVQRAAAPAEEREGLPGSSGKGGGEIGRIRKKKNQLYCHFVLGDISDSEWCHKERENRVDFGSLYCINRVIGIMKRERGTSEGQLYVYLLCPSSDLTYTVDD